MNPAPLAGALAGGRGLRLAGAAAAALLALVLLLLVPLLALLEASPGLGPGAPPPGSGIPATYVPLYQEAGRAFAVSWLVLASVHKQETGFSTHPTTYAGVNFAGCCAGPMQFNVTNGPPSTWDGHKQAFRRGRRPADYPHPQGPHPSVYDDFDAIIAAASLLHANGATAEFGSATWQAVRRYNGAGPIAVAYADAVMARARGWAAAGPSLGAPLPTSGGALSWPVRGPIVSPFGMRWGRLHAGIDIAVATGAPIYAAAAGRVTTRGWVGGYGNYTCLQHQNGLSTCYAHQSRFGPAHSGQLLTRGELVGYVGCTGHCFGPHLHFEVRIAGRPVDPEPYLGRDGR